MTNYVDRFHSAVSVLAGDGHVKNRLIRAFQDNLVELDDEELPVSVKEPFAELRQLMHSVSPLNGEGAVRASVRKMSGTEAGECAVSIVALYAEIMRLAEPLSRGKPLPVAEDAQVPPFLVKSVS